jgi:hypothetical protein
VTVKEVEEMSANWNKGDTNIPKDRRLLLIATPKGIPHVNLPLDLVVAEWGPNDEFIPVVVPYDGLEGTPPELRVHWWAEIPDLPEGVKLRNQRRR